MNTDFAQAVAAATRAHFIKIYPDIEKLLPYPICPEELTDEKIFEMLKGVSLYYQAKRHFASVVASDLYFIEARKNPVEYLRLFGL